MPDASCPEKELPMSPITIQQIIETLHYEGASDHEIEGGITTLIWNAESKRLILSFEHDENMPCWAVNERAHHGSASYTFQLVEEWA